MQFYSFFYIFFCFCFSLSLGNAAWKRWYCGYKVTVFAFFNNYLEFHIYNSLRMFLRLVMLKIKFNLSLILKQKNFYQLRFCRMKACLACPSACMLCQRSYIFFLLPIHLHMTCILHDIQLRSLHLRRNFSSTQPAGLCKNCFLLHEPSLTAALQLIMHLQ